MSALLSPASSGKWGFFTCFALLYPAFSCKQGFFACFALLYPAFSCKRGFFACFALLYPAFSLSTKEAHKLNSLTPPKPQLLEKETFPPNMIFHFLLHYFNTKDSAQNIDRVSCIEMLMIDLWIVASAAAVLGASHLGVARH